MNKTVGQDAKYVIKIEPHHNGPLFVEMNFYIRVARQHMSKYYFLFYLLINYNILIFNIFKNVNLNLIFALIKYLSNKHI